MSCHNHVYLDQSIDHDLNVTFGLDLTYGFFQPVCAARVLILTLSKTGQRTRQTGRAEKYLKSWSCWGTCHHSTNMVAVGGLGQENADQTGDEVDRLKGQNLFAFITLSLFRGTTVVVTPFGSNLRNHEIKLSNIGIVHAQI